MGGGPRPSRSCKLDAPVRAQSTPATKFFVAACEMLARSPPVGQQAPHFRPDPLQGRLSRPISTFRFGHFAAARPAMLNGRTWPGLPVRSRAIQQTFGLIAKCPNVSSRRGLRMGSPGQNLPVTNDGMDDRRSCPYRSSTSRMARGTLPSVREFRFANNCSRSECRPLPARTHAHCGGAGHRSNSKHRDPLLFATWASRLGIVVCRESSPALMPATLPLKDSRAQTPNRKFCVRLRTSRRPAAGTACV
jgi:hypothetical protein